MANDHIEAPNFDDLWTEIVNDEDDRTAVGWLWFLEHLRRCPQEEVRVSPVDMVIQLPELPAADIGSMLTLNATWSTSEKDDMRNDAQKVQATIQVATANVLSLFAGKEDKLAQGQFVSSRMEALQQQCYDASCDIFGLQETRHKAGRYIQCEHYHVLSGAATPKGHGGVQLWIAEQFTCGLKITVEQLKIKYHDAQLLIATIQHPAFIKW